MLGMAYNGSAASLHASRACAHCMAWPGLRPVGDMAIDNSHGLHQS